MASILRLLKKFLCILLFVAGVAGIFYLLLNSKKVYEYVIPRWINAQTTQFVISDFKIEQEAFRWPGKFSFDKVRFLITDGHNFYTVSARKVVVAGEPYFWYPRKQISFNMEGSNIDNPSLKVSNLALSGDIYFNLFQLEAVKGNVDVQSCKFQQYLLTEVHAPVLGYQNTIKIEPFEANFFDGRILGKIIVDNPADMSYIMEMNVHGLDLSRLEGAYPALPDNVKGQFEGKVLLKGHQARIETLRMSLTAPQGGKLKASLLKNLLQYIPAEARTTEFELAMKSNDDIFFETMNLQLYSLTDERMNAKVELESHRLNLKPNIDIDFHVEGGLNNFFNYLKNFSN